MIKSENPDIRLLEEKADGTYCKLEVEPLERGFGTTLGNSMRRVLLSSLPGVAVSSVKIEGVLHEFSTIPGVKEDVTEIILNIKGLLARLNGDGPKMVYIDKSGPCEVTAEDIRCDSEVEIIDPTMHIATLEEGAELSMEIVLERGVGYVSAEKNKAVMKPVIGVIPVDSIYTPVKRVNYHVESTRVGQSIDYDKLVLEIWTNGVINYNTALSMAANILYSHLDMFMNLDDNLAKEGLSRAKVKEQPNANLDMSVDDLELSVRAFNCLKRAGINTVEDLLNKTEQDLLKVRNMGQKSFDEVTNKIHSMGLEFKKEEEE